MSTTDNSDNLCTLIKKIDEDLKDLLDKRFNLLFDLDLTSELILEKKMLRTYYKMKLHGEIDSMPLSKQKIERLTRARSKSPVSRTVPKKRFNYGHSPK